jgi:hypothetical protein
VFAHRFYCFALQGMLQGMSMKPWKDVFWACALLFGVQLVTTAFSSAGTLWDATKLLAGGLSLIPIYGYAYQVAIGNKAIAIVIFGYNTLFMLMVVLLALYVLVTQGSLFVLFLFVLLLALSFAYLYPQYKYAFDSDDLWGAGA